MIDNGSRIAIAILIFITLLIWSLAKGGGDSQQPKLQIELRIEYGSS
jgi:hypothetical protein